MILSIDPSIRNVGWAIKDGANWEHGTIRIPKGLTLPETFIKLAIVLNNEICYSNVPEFLICEYPEFHGGSEKGATAAVNGTTFGLAAICGFLQGYYKRPASKTFFYTPSKWKGQVPKDGMLYRFEQYFGYPAKTDHEAEAAMMLVYHLNKVVK
jgi:hypothetical protein